MRISSTALCALAFGLTFIYSLEAGSSGVYRWVDSTGKVHYSQLPPKQGDTSQLKVQTPGKENEQALPQGESIRGPDGQCLTVKCMADEMESDRLAREKEYDRRRAENERHRPKKTETAKTTPHQGPLYNDEYMHTQCMHGMCGSKTSDCDNINHLRKCAERLKTERAGKEDMRQRGLLDQNYQPIRRMY